MIHCRLYMLVAALVRFIVSMIIAAALLVTSTAWAAETHHVIQADVLHIRSGPGLEYEIVWKLHHGDDVVIVDDENGNDITFVDPDGRVWCLVRPWHWRDPVGWAAKEYVK